MARFKDPLADSGTFLRKPGWDTHRGVRARLVEDLYERSRFSVPALLVVILVCRWALAPALAADRRTGVLFWAVVAAVGARLALVWLPRALRDRWGSHRVKFLAFLVLVLVLSLCLSGLAVLAHRHLEPARFSVFVVIVAGVVSSAISTLSASPMLFLLYMVPPIASLFVLTVTDHRPYWGADIMAVSLLVYAAASTLMSFSQYRMLRRNALLSLALEEKAVRDNLTNLYNRHFLQEFMEREAANLKRKLFLTPPGGYIHLEEFLGFFILDLDFFKDVNDAGGHAAGDRLLKGLSGKLLSEMRQSDVLVRWGGDEFVVVSRIDGVNDLKTVAEKLHQLITEYDFRLPGGRVAGKTVSIGFSVFPFFAGEPFALGWEQVLSLADAALYRSKLEGRNRSIGILPGLSFPNRPADIYQTAIKDLDAAERGAWIKILR